MCAEEELGLMVLVTGLIVVDDTVLFYFLTNIVCDVRFENYINKR